MRTGKLLKVLLITSFIRSLTLTIFVICFNSTSKQITMASSAPLDHDDAPKYGSMTLPSSCPRSAFVDGHAPSSAIPSSPISVFLSAVVALVLLPLAILTFLLDRIIHAATGGYLPFLYVANRIRVAIALSPKLSKMSLFRALCDSVVPREFLDFAVIFGGDRKRLFKARMEEQGAVYYQASGFWTTSHFAVSDVLSRPQGRAVLIGTSPISSPEVFHPSAPIMLSNGTGEHRRVRSMIDGALLKSKAVGERVTNASEVLRPILDDWHDAHGADHEETEFFENPITVELATECLFMIILGKRISKEAIDLAISYNKQKLYVLLPRFLHAILLQSLTRKTEKIRKDFANAIDLANHPPFVSAAAEVDIDMDDAALIAADILLFAGVIGTSHLTGSVLDRIRDHPAMYAKDPRSFVYECARTDPPVTSLTTVLTEDTPTVWMGKDVTLPSGTPLSAVISTANTDPAVWGPNAAAFDISRDYSKLLSWNGSLGKADSGSSRFCPGKDISFAVVTTVAASIAGDVVDLRSPRYCLINIMTGATRDAGTKKAAFMRLHGSEGQTSGDMELPSADYQVGQTAVHRVPLPEDIEEITAISLWQAKDSKFDLDFSPNWYVDQIITETVVRKKMEKYDSSYTVFPYYSWVRTEPKTVLAGQAKIFQNLTPAERVMHQQYLKEKEEEYNYTSR